MTVRKDQWLYILLEVILGKKENRSLPQQYIFYWEDNLNRKYVGYRKYHAETDFFPPVLLHSLMRYEPSIELFWLTCGKAVVDNCQQWILSMSVQHRVTCHLSK